MTQYPKVENSNSSKDPLIVGSGLMARSRTKKVSESMGMLVQSTFEETSVLEQKETSLFLSSRAESKWLNLIQVKNEVDKVLEFRLLTAGS